ncbi:MAG TPA: hypothetical protein VEU98_02435 [Candidatus Eremiobacteraceae bacterium]|nr:hypothetical protein [Candidatus Eremiobacteraceae bacterium]
MQTRFRGEVAPCAFVGFVPSRGAGGLAPADRVIVSDISTWNRYDQVRLQ